MMTRIALFKWAAGATSRGICLVPDGNTVRARPTSALTAADIAHFRQYREHWRSLAREYVDPVSHVVHWFGWIHYSLTDTMYVWPDARYPHATPLPDMRDWWKRVLARRLYLSRGPDGSIALSPGSILTAEDVVAAAAVAGQRDAVLEKWESERHSLSHETRDVHIAAATIVK